MLEEVRGLLLAIDDNDHCIGIGESFDDEEIMWYKLKNLDYWDVAKNSQGEEIIALQDGPDIVALKCSVGMTEEDIAEFKKEVYKELDSNESLIASIPTEKLVSEVEPGEIEEKISAAETAKEPPVEYKRSRFYKGSGSASLEKRYRTVDTTPEEREMRKYCVEQAVSIIAAAIRSTPTDVTNMSQEQRYALGKTVSTIARELERYITQKYVTDNS